MNELLYASINRLTKALLEKEVSSREIVQASLDRIESINPRLNAVVQLTADTALKQADAADTLLHAGEARGPLHGIPMTIKDSFDTAGLISTAGTMGRQSCIPVEDATVVHRLRRAGAILLGKTNTPEFTLSYETDNLVYGRTNNPYDLSRTPGGSSGGAAAIVAAGGATFDIGSDTGGSIRQPAHFCGVAGIKPTSGRVPRTGHIISYDQGAMDGLTQIGPIARYVDDLSLIMPIISGVDWKDPAVVPLPMGAADQVNLSGLRVAYYTDNGIVPPTLDTINTLVDVISLLTDCNMKVTEDIPEDVTSTGGLWLELLTADGGAWIQRLLDKCGTDDIHSVIKDRFLGCEAISSSKYTELLSHLDAIKSRMLTFINNYDVIICPTNAYPAMLHEEAADKAIGFSYTRIYNLTGLPAVTVRAGTSVDGLPIGIQVISKPWREDIALAVAGHIENTLGGWQRPILN